MKREIQIFNHPQFGEIRTVDLNGDIRFVGKDVAEVLGYSNTRDAIRKHVDAEDKTTVAICDTGSSHKSKKTLINESGLFALILRSNMPQAKEFKHWVTSEVLPSIRKNGAYMTDTTIDTLVEDPDLVIKLARKLRSEKECTRLANKTVEEQRQMIQQQQDTIEEQGNTINTLTNENKAMAEKASYLDNILSSDDTVFTSQIAQDYGMSAFMLNRILHDEHIQYKLGDQWILYQEYKNKGYVKSETLPRNRKDGSTFTIMVTKWTQRGRAFLYLILKGKGILPMTERQENLLMPYYLND